MVQPATRFGPLDFHVADPGRADEAIEVLAFLAYRLQAVSGEVSLIDARQAPANPVAEPLQRPCRGDCAHRTLMC
jgi:hypothetical protein